MPGEIRGIRFGSEVPTSQRFAVDDFDLSRPCQGDHAALFQACERTAYGLNDLSFSGAAADGHGQTIAIVDAFNDPNVVGDLNTFDKAFGTTSTGSTLYQKYGAASSLSTALANATPASSRSGATRSVRFATKLPPDLLRSMCRMG